MSGPPLPENFGNYAIRGIAEVLPPGPVSWWPATEGWAGLGIALLAVLCWLGFRRYRRWRHDWYRRDALARLAALDELPGENRLPQLAALLKATALAAYPREEIAALSGEAWLRWLGSTTSTPVFDEESGRLLSHAQYRVNPQLPPEALEQLTRDCADWIRRHEVPAA